MPDSKEKTILITGGAGFIATHVARKLLESGYRVRSLDIRDPQNPVDGVDYIKGDVRVESDLEKAVRGTSGVFHYAAIVSVPLCQEQPAESYQTNLMGTVKVLDAIHAESQRRGEPVKILFAGSSAVYGRAGKEGKAIRESDVVTDPLGFYAAQKLGSEQAIRLSHESRGIPAVVFRFFNVFGPGQDPSSPYSGVISIFSLRSGRGEDLTVHGDGKQTRDFVSVHDVARAGLLGLELDDGKCDGQAINLGTGNSVTIVGLAREVMKAAGKEVKVHHGPARQGDVPHSMADISRAKSVLNWTPEWTLGKGLKELLG